MGTGSNNNRSSISSDDVYNMPVSSEDAVFAAQEYLDKYLVITNDLGKIG